MTAPVRTSSPRSYPSSLILWSLDDNAASVESCIRNLFSARQLLWRRCNAARRPPTIAEVLIGLQTAFNHYSKGEEKPWKR